MSEWAQNGLIAILVLSAFANVMLCLLLSLFLGNTQELCDELKDRKATEAKLRNELFELKIENRLLTLRLEREA